MSCFVLVLSVFFLGIPVVALLMASNPVVLGCRLVSFEKGGIREADTAGRSRGWLFRLVVHRSCIRGTKRRRSSRPTEGLTCVDRYDTRLSSTMSSHHTLQPFSNRITRVIRV